MSLAHINSFVRHPVVFLTACTAKRAKILSNETAHLRLLELWRESLPRNGWHVGRYVIMPDHVHLFARPDLSPEPLGLWVSKWKSLSARAVVAAGVASAPVWQRDYFDRYIRSGESYVKKWDYVVNNPVRAGLVRRSEDWPYQGVIHDLGRC